jgi:flagellar motor switch protein FliN/FliY
MQQWAEAMAQVLEQIASSPFSLTLSDAADPLSPAAEGDLLAVVAAEGGLRGEISLRFPRAAALGVAQVFVGEPANPAAEFGREHREAVEEWLRQVAGVAASRMKERWGEVSLRVEIAGQTPSWSAAARGQLASSAGAPLVLQVEWQVSAALQAALLTAQTASHTPRNPARPPAAADDALDLVMDVGLAVTLRFGSRNLLLREVLELAPGAVVELSQQVHDPAELLLDGRVIARGEVVIVDGNYGLRVQDVADPRSSG